MIYSFIIKIKWIFDKSKNFYYNVLWNKIKRRTLMPTEVQIMMLENRKKLIMTRNPAVNINIAHKIDRKLRKLRNE